MRIENESVNALHHPEIDITNANESQIITYSFVRDIKGNSLSFNFNKSSSQNALSGFEEPLPLEWITIVKQILESSEFVHYPSGSTLEFEKIIRKSGKLHHFSIIIVPITIGSKSYSHYIIQKKAFNTNKLVNMHEINAKCISSTSHDFRTPLSIIYTNLQLLEHEEFLTDKESRDDALLLSKMAVKSLVRILDKTSIIDSINKERLEYKPVKVYLHDICRRLSNDLNDLEIIPERIVYIGGDGIGEVELDTYLFKQLFSNLILNALDFSRKQSKVSFESKCINKNNLQFIIKDSGIGIDQKQVSDLEFFFNNDDVKITEGVGLGFIIAKECIRLQGGKIYISSTVGEGSTFIVDLPLNSL